VAGDQIGDRGARVANPETVRSVLHNELRVHVARSRHISLVERGRSAPRQLLYLEFKGGPPLGRSAARARNWPVIGGVRSQRKRRLSPEQGTRGAHVPIPACGWGFPPPLTQPQAAGTRAARSAPLGSRHDHAMTSVSEPARLVGCGFAAGAFGSRASVPRSSDSAGPIRQLGMVQERPRRRSLPVARWRAPVGPAAD